MNEIYESFSGYLTKDSKKFLVAFSGGLDSTVLLYALKQALVKEKLNKEILAIHVDHKQNKNSKNWIEHCKKFCETMQVSFACSQIKSNKKALSENDLRNLRYEIFSEFVDKNSTLFLAHHLDDQIETFFFRIFRGTGMDGIVGIPEERAFNEGRLVRPFLGLSKDLLLTYAKKHKLDFIKDPSNKDTSFDRNYIRKNIIPKIKNRWPNYENKVQSFIDIQKEYLGVAETSHDFSDAELSKNTLNLRKLIDEKDSQKKIILRKWIKLNGLNSPNQKVLDNLINIFIKTSKNNSYFHWGAKGKKGSVSIKKTKECLVVSELI